MISSSWTVLTSERTRRRGRWFRPRPRPSRRRRLRRHRRRPRPSSLPSLSRPPHTAPRLERRRLFPPHRALQPPHQHLHRPFPLPMEHLWSIPLHLLQGLPHLVQYLLILQRNPECRRRPLLFAPRALHLFQESTGRISPSHGVPDAVDQLGAIGDRVGEVGVATATDDRAEGDVAGVLGEATAADDVGREGLVGGCIRCGL